MFQALASEADMSTVAFGLMLGLYGFGICLVIVLGMLYDHRQDKKEKANDQ